MSRIFFIGNLQWGRQSTGGGVQTKNQLFLKYIMGKTSNVAIYDTWEKSPLTAFMMSCFYIVSAKKDDPIILSISTRGPYWIAKLCKFMRLHRRIFYWVAGGDLAFELKEKSKNKRSVYSYFEKVVVQCEYLKNDLEKLGFENCIVVSNFKPIIFNPPSTRNYDNPTRYVFFSRILKEKGVEEIVEAVKLLDDRNIHVDFYGTLWPPYTENYFTNLSSWNIHYKGFLNVSVSEGYKLLSEYDVLLFPTYYIGEGFPGTLLDSFIAGVPVIASQFHANSEVIKNGYNGIIIPPRDIKSLAEAISILNTDKKLLMKLRHNAILSAGKYEVNIVLDKAFKELNIIL